MRYPQMGSLFLVAVALVSCATVERPPLAIPSLPVDTGVLSEPVAPEPPLAAEERHVLLDEPVWVEGPPLKVAVKAEKLAMLKPALAGFDRAMLVYPYRPYATYWADVPVRGSLHIQLQPGEVIRLVGGLRETDWIVQRDDAVTLLEVSHLLVTPQELNIEGRMTLVTSWGVYYVLLHSQETSGLYGLSWRHPPKRVP